MIGEQALMYLPEVLTGTGYPDQAYEGGIVTAYSLSLLQALNARNIPNPISCIQTERPLQGEMPWSHHDGEPRYLRCDLFLNLERNLVESTGLLAYGWRLHNWFEAKFFRKSTSVKQQNTADLLADLLRLLVLVPEERSGEKSVTGRFLLHVYEGQPEDYLSPKRNTGRGLEERQWLAPLLSSGRGRCDRIKLGEHETETVLSVLNTELSDIEIEFECTTFRIDPVIVLPGNTRQFVCVLTRIDAFSVWRGEVKMQIQADQAVAHDPNSAAVERQVLQHVGCYIKSTRETEKAKPSKAESAGINEETWRLHEIDMAVEDAGLSFNPNTGRLEATRGAEAENSLDHDPDDAFEMLEDGISREEFSEYLQWKTQRADEDFHEREADALMESLEQEGEAEGDS